MAKFGTGYGDGYTLREAVYGDEIDLGGPISGEHGQPPNGMAAHLLDGYNSKYREMIDLVDRLREYGLEKELPLPQVAVVGVQTSGKSSVLEGISGVQLPRGTGIVTRCPIELRLKASSDRSSPWSGRVSCENGEGQKMDTALRSPDDVADQVLRAQNFLAGDHDISTRRVILEVQSPYVPDLTLIDLPGLIEVAMDGQPHDIVEKVHRIVNHYVYRTETIIMVVIPCTMELATTRALKMALEADRDGNRTLGVLTKPDLVDRGAEDDIVKMVRSPDQFKIRKGFTVVKLRSKEDITNGMSLQVALQKEQEWFGKNPHFKKLPKYVVGTKSLAVKLTRELVARIKSILPSLKADVHTKMEEVDEKLEALGRGIPEDDFERKQLLTDLLNDFTDKIVRICEGTYDRHVPTDQRLLIWTRPYIEDFAAVVGELMPEESDAFLRERIEREIREQRGMELPGFLPWLACKNIIQRLMDSYIAPSRDCLHKVNSVVEEFLRKVADEKFVAYPGLQSQVKSVVDDIQQAQLQTCGKALEELFDIEMMVVVPDMLFYKGSARTTKRDRRDRRDSDDMLGDNHVSADGSPRLAQQEKRAVAGYGSWWGNRSRVAGTSPDTQDKASQEGSSEGSAGGNYTDYPTDQAGTRVPPTVYVPAETANKENATFTLDRIVIYFRTALERLMGTVPARIHYHLVHRLSLDIRSHVTNLATDVTTLANLVEGEKTAKIRRELLERRVCLQKSLEELNRF